MRTAIFSLMLASMALSFGAHGGDASANAVKVGEESIVMADGPGKSLRGLPAVVFGKESYLVVWQEGQVRKGSQASVWAARVSTDGKLLDAKGIEVANCKNSLQERPRVAFASGVFLVVWQDFRNGQDFDVLGARISPDGRVLDAQPIAIAIGPRTQVLPDVAADDPASPPGSAAASKGFLVAWQGFQGNEEVCRSFVARVEQDGKVGQPVALKVGSNPRIAWNGKEFLAVFTSDGGNSFQSMRLDADGKPARQPGNLISGTTTRFVASVGGVPGKGWLVVMPRSRPDFWGHGGPGAMICQSIDTNGKTSVDIPVMPSGNWNRMPNWLDVGDREKKLWPFGVSAVASDGKQPVVAWTRWHLGGATGIDFVNGEIMVARVEGWKPVDSDAVAVANSPASESNPAIASNGAGNLLCVYEKELDDGKAQICARTLKTE
ncbi:MAG: hypothetical protein C0404_10075 [Verrucomicrobia bacterium]|nr:hypothetical protein [Verrucomicrobiota bacterium]